MATAATSPTAESSACKHRCKDKSRCSHKCCKKRSPKEEEAEKPDSPTRDAIVDVVKRLFPDKSDVVETVLESHSWVVDNSIVTELQGDGVNTSVEPPPVEKDTPEDQKTPTSCESTSTTPRVTCEGDKPAQEQTDNEEKNIGNTEGADDESTAVPDKKRPMPDDIKDKIYSEEANAPKAKVTAEGH
ncbi:hypothetical protein Pelo_15228 [Pelomyxa schiedti]|nr:hypothetical protein Pelo_15228 [Pelomyxa schiedti]